MLKYLIIQLCDTAPSFCHYENEKREACLISLEDLKAGILFGMKENLNIQFLYPEYELPKEYKEAIDEIDHVDIVGFNCEDSDLVSHGDVIVINSWKDVDEKSLKRRNYVVRTSKDDLFNHYAKLIEALPTVERMNVVLTDVPKFRDEDVVRYKSILAEIAVSLEKEYVEGKSPQTNLLTDRMVLKEMNNCNAGNEVITLAPDGKFYICPAFYIEGREAVGCPASGVEIRNPQLFKLEYAPICRKCDAYQCKRCVWLNEKLTLEVNTPGRQQCVISHLERNESRRLLNKIRQHGVFMPEIEIHEIDYLDPFEIANQWK